MTKEYLESVMTQVVAQRAMAEKQIQAVEGAIQLLQQLINAETQTSIGGGAMPQGITGPVIPPTT